MPTSPPQPCGAITSAPAAKTNPVSSPRTFLTRPSNPARSEPPALNGNLAMSAQLKKHLANVVAALCERRRVAATVKHAGRRPPLQTEALRLVLWTYYLFAG